MTQFIKYKNDGDCVFIVNMSEIISFEPTGSNVKLTLRTFYGSGTHELPMTMDDLIAQMENSQNDMIVNIDCSSRENDVNDTTFHDFSPITKAVVIRQYSSLTSEEANKPPKKVFLQREGRDSDAIYTTNINKVGLRQDGLLQFYTFACNHDPIHIEDYDDFVVKLKKLINSDDYTDLSVNLDGVPFLIENTTPDIIEPMGDPVMVKVINKAHITPPLDETDPVRPLKRVWFNKNCHEDGFIYLCNINKVEFYADGITKFVAFISEYPTFYVRNYKKFLSELKELRDEKYYISLTIHDDGDVSLTKDAIGADMLAVDIEDGKDE